MKQYCITFYKKRNNVLRAVSVFYREFQTIEELIIWCNSIKNECNYYRFSHKQISKEQYLKNI